MHFNLSQSILLLERTPAILNTLLRNLPDEWVYCNEGYDTWCAYDIIGHLIHGEKTDWMPRMDIILSENADKHFVPFDRFAQVNESKGKTIAELLDEFEVWRKKNISYLLSKNLAEADLEKKGIHPAFGEVTLSQLLATWVVHDQNHLVQIARVMAKHYKEDVGPWKAYLKILQ